MTVDGPASINTWYGEVRVMREISLEQPIASCNGVLSQYSERKTGDVSIGLQGQEHPPPPLFQKERERYDEAFDATLYSDWVNGNSNIFGNDTRFRGNANDL